MLLLCLRCLASSLLWNTCPRGSKLAARTPAQRCWQEAVECKTKYSSLIRGISPHLVSSHLSVNQFPKEDRIFYLKRNSKDRKNNNSYVRIHFYTNHVLVFSVTYPNISSQLAKQSLHTETWHLKTVFWIRLIHRLYCSSIFFVDFCCFFPLHACFSWLVIPLRLKIVQCCLDGTAPYIR